MLIRQLLVTPTHPLRFCILLESLLDLLPMIRAEVCLARPSILHLQTRFGYTLSYPYCGKGSLVGLLAAYNTTGLLCCRQVPHFISKSDKCAL